MSSVEKLSDYEPGNAGVVKRWLEELDMAGQWQRDWEKRAKEVINVYNGETQTSFNILHSNVETLRPNLFAQKPEPDIRRRVIQQGNADREAAEVIERCVRYCNDTGRYEDNVIEATNDYMLAGRCTIRIRYTPTVVRRNEALGSFQDANEITYFTDAGNIVDAEDVSFDGDGNPFMEVEEVIFERTDLEHVPYQRFRHHPASRWEDVRWVAFLHHFTREGLDNAFGKAKSKRTALTVEEGTQTAKNDTEVNPDLFKRAEVWEVWDKEAREILFISPGNVDEPLLKVPDGPEYYNLRGFFPTPEPLRSLRTPGSLLPVPEYTIYQDLAYELDEITKRITEIVKAIDVRGAYNGAISELGAILDSPNKLIPIEAWDSFVERGGLDAMLSFIDIEPNVRAFVALQQQRVALIETIYQTIGLSDISRGASDPRETATAQRLKGDFGQLRLTPRQREWQRYLRDLMRIEAELIAEKFEPQTLQQMTGMEITPEVMGLLRNDALRNFAIDIETDSTISIDQAKVQADLKEMLEGLAASAEAAQALPEAARMPFVRGVVRKLKLGRDVEIALEEAEGQPQQPSGDILKAQQDAQLKQAELAQKDADSQRKDETKNRELDIKEAELVTKAIQGVA